MENGFAHIIRAERERLGLSRSSFSELVGSSLASVKRWEAGQSIPNPSQRELVLNAIHHGGQISFSRERCHPGWWLRICRLRQKITIRKAAELTSTSASAWQRYETGEILIGVSQALELSKMLGCTLSFEKRLMQSSDQFERLNAAFKLTGTDPFIGIESVMGVIFELEKHRCNMAPEEHRKLLCEAHAVLGHLIISCGGHGLAGKSFAAAIRIGKREDFSISSFENVYFSTVWNGFQSISNTEDNTKRFEWLEGKMMTLSLCERSKYPMPRAMFAGWAERPDLAFGILDEFKKSSVPDTDDIGANLVTAWLMIKFGDPEIAVQIAEPWTDSVNQNVKLAAHKFLFEGFLKLREIKLAELQFEELLQIEKRCGMWSPGISSKVRQRFEC